MKELALALALAQQGDPQELMAKAQSLVQVGELDRALALYLDGSRGASPSFDALVNAGFVAKSLGRLAQARELFELARRLAPSHPYPLEMLGTVAFELGELDHSVELLRQALAQHPGDVRIKADLDSVIERRGTMQEFADARQRLARIAVTITTTMLAAFSAAVWFVSRAAKRARPSPGESDGRQC